MSKPKIAIIIGSTRDTRFADKPAQWVLEHAKKRTDLEFELVDLRDFDLPFFNEVASNAWVPSKDERAVKWQKKIAEFDGYLFIVSEYNRSITGALKNALDQAYKEWTHKVMAAVGYGSVGGARAVEHLRLISIELQMVPVRHAVHIGGGDFFKVSPLGENQPISAIEGSILKPLNNTFDDLVWWGNATKAARAKG
jgi:NAD(P)H-dependent FMN reductase